GAETRRGNRSSVCVTDAEEESHGQAAQVIGIIMQTMPSSFFNRGAIAKARGKTMPAPVSRQVCCMCILSAHMQSGLGHHQPLVSMSHARGNDADCQIGTFGAG